MRPMLVPQRSVDPGDALKFEGRSLPVQAGDTIAATLYRAGVRTFSRSFKYHRRRGLYCLTGDCPNCLVNVDGAPCVRACSTPARPGAVVHRENAWPSVDRDLLRCADFVHWLLPVGFYYKTLIRPRWLWPLVEPLLRRIAGLGSIAASTDAQRRECRHRHVDVLVIGAGVAGLSAAIAAAEEHMSVLVCDEGQLGEQVAPGATCEAIMHLAKVAAALPSLELLERAPALGIYEGPLVPLDSADELQLVHAERVIVATGAIERHPVFPGNDLPGVFLARGAARLAGRYGLLPGQVAVAAVRSQEGIAHVQTLVDAGVRVAAALVPEDLALWLPDGVPAVIGSEIVRAVGRRRVRGVVVKSGSGRRRRIACDSIVLSMGWQPRDGLLRQADGLPVVGAGDVISAGNGIDSAIASGRAAVLGEATAAASEASKSVATGGFICLCEDVTGGDLERAWAEGFDSTELLKRYTTVSMGPCQGALCQAHLRQFVADKIGTTVAASQPTTARPPARGVTLERVAAGGRHPLEQRTRLDAKHLELGARMEPAGIWRRPSDYGEPSAEYMAVRQNVGIIDVGTLGKFHIAGRDAAEFLDRLYPCRVSDLAPGRLRYALLLAESGYVVDDGIICALDSASWYLTFTSGGADRVEAWLHDWVDTWDLDVHIVNRTAALGAINVAGPKARQLLQSISSDDLDSNDFRYLTHREIEVATVPCRAIRLGFVGELSYELHHPSSRSVELWDALLDAGRDLGVRPHGLEALRLLRLEKGHVIIDQDTDYDSTPAKLGMDWAVKMDKPGFVGKIALERLSQRPLRKRLVALRFDGGAPAEGAPLSADGRYAGYLTSSRFSPLLACGVALGWLERRGEEFPSVVQSQGLTGTVVEGSAYDPEGLRLRA